MCGAGAAPAGYKEQEQEQEKEHTQEREKPRSAPRSSEQRKAKAAARQASHKPQQPAKPWLRRILGPIFDALIWLWFSRPVQLVVLEVLDSKDVYDKIQGTELSWVGRGLNYVLGSIGSIIVKCSRIVAQVALPCILNFVIIAIDRSIIWTWRISRYLPWAPITVYGSIVVGFHLFWNIFLQFGADWFNLSLSALAVYSVGACFVGYQYGSNPERWHPTNWGPPTWPISPDTRFAWVWEFLAWPVAWQFFGTVFVLYGQRYWIEHSLFYVLDAGL